MVILNTINLYNILTKMLAPPPPCIEDFGAKYASTQWSYFIFFSAKLGFGPAFAESLNLTFYFIIFFFLCHLSWIKWGGGFVIVTTDHMTAVVQTGLFVHRWKFVLYKSTNCTDVTVQLYTSAKLFVYFNKYK